MYKLGYKIRAFKYHEWQKCETREEKYTYLKTKMNKVPQDAEKIKKKYYYNWDV